MAWACVPFGAVSSAIDACTFDVAVNVPSEVGEGPWVNVTSEVTGEASGVPVSGGPATDELQIAALTLSKAFGTDIAQPGDTVSLTFTIANDGSETATGLSFNDNLNAMLAGLEATGLPLTDICGEGSQIDGLGSLSFVDGSVPPNGSCTFSVDVVVPASAAPGVYVNVTEELRQESLTVGDRATASLEISGLSLSKSFSSATAQAGDLVMLTFPIANSGASTASELAFVDDLDAMLSGLEAVGLPLADPCGSGSELDGTSYLTFLGGSLPAGGSCTFSVNVAIPESAVAGVYENVTSELTRGGDEVAGPASATLEIIVIGPIDTDGDGVFDGVDVCEGTVIPESVPTHHLKPNRYALVDSDFIFDTEPPPGGGGGPGDVFTTTDTGGCSCEQIIVALGLGQGHVKFGCAVGVMRNWVNLVAFGPDITMDSFDDGTLDGWNVVD